ncbi:peptidase inhibitor family I36 protein [Micromonospora sp. NPDC049102]|uniref:peptidase inhibitor family I36 protein n=1 Tax=Micromonospora sp. NPDC049102 TaxID=3364265 RepID=UPI00370FECAF
MSNRRFRNVAVGVVSAAVGALTLAPGVAHADPYPCKGNQVCIYENPNFSGSVANLPELQAGGSGQVDFGNRFFQNGNPLDDRASSVKNFSGRTLVLSVDHFGSGATDTVEIAPGAKVNLRDRQRPFGNFDNVASSAWLQ